MDFLRPAGRQQALAAKAEHPSAVLIAGGTDVMVEIDFDRRRPAHLLDLNRVGELQERETAADTVRLGASVPYARIMAEPRAELPGLARAREPHRGLPADPQPRRRSSPRSRRAGGVSPASDSSAAPEPNCPHPARS